MTRRQELLHYHHSLNEIRSILNAMKTLAYMETRKLSTFLDSQHKVVEGITEVATDFLSFYPETLPKETNSTHVYLLVGTERGFCGDFNQTLMHHVESSFSLPCCDSAKLIVIGRKLYNLLQDDLPVFARIDGASVVEEVSGVLDEVVHFLAELQAEHPMLSLFSVYHSEEEGVITRKLLPPFQNDDSEKPSFIDPPVLNIPPKEFLLNVTDQYLFAALYELIYTSLLEENRRRMVHLEGAIKHLDDVSAQLSQQFNVLRREEIIEEIEVLLLNTGSFEDEPD